MATADPRAPRPEGRVISFYHLDVRVEARRLGAAAFDLLVLFVLQTWINDVFGVTHMTGGSPLRQIGGYAYVTTATTIGAPWLALLVVAYFAVQEALFGATWGKLVAGLRVVAVDGLRPSLGAVLVRNILRLIDWWPFFYLAGAVLALLSPRRQRLGDRVARTLVVRAESAVLAYRPPAEVRRRVLALAAVLVLCVAGCLAFSYYGRPPLVIEGLVNTNTLVGGPGIASYSLGAPRWGNGSVSYPIHYRLNGTYKDCRGLVTLRWAGFFTIGGGWMLAGSGGSCR